MELKNACLFHKFGYCRRYLDKCRKEHFKEICDSVDCDMNICHKRHPINCRFYDSFQRCKFGDFCMFKHVARETRSDKVYLKVAELENGIKILNDEKEALSNRIYSLETIVKNISEKLKCETSSNSNGPAFITSNSMQRILPKSNSPSINLNILPILQLDGLSSSCASNTYEEEYDAELSGQIDTMRKLPQPHPCLSVPQNSSQQTPIVVDEPTQEKQRDSSRPTNLSQTDIDDIKRARSSLNFSPFTDVDLEQSDSAETTSSLLLKAVEDFLAENLRIPPKTVAKMKIKNLSYGSQRNFETITAEFENMASVYTVFKHVQNLKVEQKVSIVVPDVLDE